MKMEVFIERNFFNFSKQKSSRPILADDLQSNRNNSEFLR
jgi:hypothetical protein